MLTVHSGPFHPQLEDAFVENLRGLAAPFAPVLIVTPSSRLNDHVQLLVSRHLQPTAGLHFLTLAKLAEPLVWEAGGLKTDKGKPLPIVSDPLFFDTLVKLILRSDRPFTELDNLAVPDGFPPSVRSTLRDLMDAGVDPENLLQAVNEREEFNIPEVDAGTLKQLIHLHRLYLKRIEEMKVAPRGRMTEAATALAPASRWLPSFKAVLFYGFYDLTGLQSELFAAVARSHPDVRFFFPYVHEHPDYAFAAHFREDILHKIPHEETLLAEAGEDVVLHRAGGHLRTDTKSVFPKAVAWKDLDARVVNVSGVRDEAWAIAAEILRLHDEDGVPFSDMAVVSRLRERLSEFGPVFAERGIPFVTSEKPTLAGAPQIPVAVELLTLASSPESPPSRDLQLNPDLRVEGIGSAGPWADERSWKEHVAWADAVLERTLAPKSDESARVWNTMRGEMRKLSDFDRLGKRVGWEDFVAALRDRWTRSPAPVEPGGLGVALLHAEAARGLSYEALFLAGLEERVFPRVVREDPFLRDPARRVIFNTLGNKIGLKMTALEEERLLLHLIARAARKHLYVTYQRSDDEGKIVGASSFLRRLVDEWGVSLENAANVVPRRLADRLVGVPPSLLSRSDVLTGLLIADRDKDAIAFTKALGRDAARVERTLSAQRALDSFRDAGGHDGIVGPDAGLAFLSERGLSASALETFARCPFQFFVRYVLRLAPPDEAASPEEMEAREKGTLVHGFLERFYEACAAKFGAKWPSALPADLFTETFDAAFAQRPAEMYPVLWDALRERLRRQLETFLSTDFETLAANDLTPSYFESRHESGDLDPALSGVRFHGVMDRIDIGPGRARVVDYKTGRRSSTKVATLVLRGKRVQPTLYLLMAAEFLKKEGKGGDVDFAYLHLDEEEPLSAFTAEDFGRERAAIIDTLKTELDLIRRGVFPIQPGDVCDSCDVSSICRRTDAVSRFRAEGSLGELRRLQEKRSGAAS